MREQSTRELLIMAALFSAAFSALNLWQTGDVLTVAATAPIFFVVLFLSMRLSNRVLRFVAHRFWPPAQPSEPAPPPARSSERPQHALRRRQGRRRRGRGRRL